VLLSSNFLAKEVGTRLYIAPEVQSRKRGPRNHSKADLYSLGVGFMQFIYVMDRKAEMLNFKIVFFEMNKPFSTDAERIAVLENLRKEEVLFPQDWPAYLTQQRQSE
jgi:eukaryotic translation initiation factor 2-alpha kinase 4